MQHYLSSLVFTSQFLVLQNPPGGWCSYSLTSTALHVSVIFFFAVSGEGRTVCDVHFQCQYFQNGYINSRSPITFHMCHWRLETMSAKVRGFLSHGQKWEEDEKKELSLHSYKDCSTREEYLTSQCIKWMETSI